LSIRIQTAMSAPPNRGQNGFCKTNPIWNLFLGFNPPYLSMQKNEKRVDFFINV
jgi:hypothetical protein